MNSSVLPIAFTLILIGITATTAQEPVLDTTGQKVRAGAKYFILPATKGGFILQVTKGGGLTLSPRANSTCPLFVVQEKHAGSNGQAVTFSPSVPNKDGVIVVSTDLNIKSAVKSTRCEPPSPVWRLLKEISEALFVSTGGVEGNPGPDTLFNWFKIEKDGGRDYHFYFCPEAGKGSISCSVLGIYVDTDGSRHLAVGNNLPPFKVVFKRA